MLSKSGRDVAFAGWGVHNMDMEGAQLVGRVAAVLRAVSAAMPSGATTAAVADATGLARPTAHRILSSLAADGFVDRGDGRWYLGPELYLMGAVAAERYDAIVIQAGRETPCNGGKAQIDAVLERAAPTVVLVRPG